MTYRGDVVFAREGERVIERPLRLLGDLHVGLQVWVPSPTGRAYFATVQWDCVSGFYWRCGTTVGWLAFSEDERRCWVSTGASRWVVED